MLEIDAATTIMRQQAERHSLLTLAREAGVPYTTVKSLADRGWRNKNLTAFARLYQAAERLAKRELGK